MYKVTFQDNSKDDAYYLCYDEKGNLFGYVAYNSVFKSLEKVKSIDKEVTVTERIWPPVAAPEKRLFKVGDRVKVVSLDHKDLKWSVVEGMKIGTVLQVKSIINDEGLNLSDNRSYHPYDLAHID